MPRKRVTALVALLIVIVGLIAYFESQKPERVAFQTEGGPLLAIPTDQKSEATEGEPESASSTSQLFRPMPSSECPIVREIVGASGFINAEPFKLADVVGKKVILIDFWTYSCINCQRTTPYLNAWYEKYRNEGLEIVGIHTPEFEFEKQYANVERAVAEADIRYPVVLDNDYATWSAYGNRFWPRKYLVDINGNIVFDHIGEGAYAETELKIQELLWSRKAALGEGGIISSGMSEPLTAVAVDAGQLRSPEIYFGAARNEYFRNGVPFKEGIQTLHLPSLVKTGELYLVGEWELTNEYARSRSVDAKIVFRYLGKNVYFVGSSEDGSKARVLRDGMPIEHEAGADVQDGLLLIKDDRLYTLVEEDAYGEHTLEVIIPEPGLRAFTFTFG